MHFFLSYPKRRIMTDFVGTNIDFILVIYISDSSLVLLIFQILKLILEFSSFLKWLGKIIRLISAFGQCYFKLKLKLTFQFFFRGIDNIIHIKVIKGSVQVFKNEFLVNHGFLMHFKEIWLIDNLFEFLIVD